MGFKKFKKRTEPIHTSDFWYDLTDGGYIDPNDLLISVLEAREIMSAICLLEDFKRGAIKAGVIEEV